MGWTASQVVQPSSLRLDIGGGGLHKAGIVFVARQPD